MLYPAQVWDCYCATVGQKETFPVILGNAAADPKDLLGAAPSHWWL